MDWWRSFTKVWTSTRGRLHRGMDRWRSFTKVWTGGGAHHRAPDLVVETREILASWSGGGHGPTATGQLSGSTVVRIFIS
ncbi:unnamed protein product [Sphagnum jensenii]|uniref:Uncharacterized protein n=1 Tax=Sphagnum jensenii TaxID=128206 RepID=A0ABP0W6L6_9BRYO